MKKTIASAMAVLMASLGFVVVDNTITDRVSNLESQVSSLAQISVNASNDIYNMGDKITCSPAAPHSFDATIADGSVVTVNINSFTAEIVSIGDELATNGGDIQLLAEVPDAVVATTTTQSEATTTQSITTTVRYYKVYTKSYTEAEIVITGNVICDDIKELKKIQIEVLGSNPAVHGCTISSYINQNGSFIARGTVMMYGLDTFSISNIYIQA